MDKFQKSEIIQDQRGNESARYNLSGDVSLDPNDPSVLRIMTSDRGIVEFNFSNYVNGNAKLGYIENPNLLRLLIPAIKTHLGYAIKTRKACASWLTKRLPTIFRYTSSLIRETGSAPQSPSEFTDEDGLLLKNHLISSEGSAVDKRKYYTSVLSLLNNARKETDPVLTWPTFDISKTTRVHRDVDPRAVKALYHAGKRIVADANSFFGVRQWAKIPSLGKAEYQALFSKSTPDEVLIDLLKHIPSLLLVQKAYIEDRIVGSQRVSNRLKALMDRKLANNLQAGIRPFWTDVRDWASTSSKEIHASMLLVSMETGWIDTVHGIDVTREWYQFRGNSEESTSSKTDTVVIFATRPKTSKPIVAIGMAGARFRSFRLIRSALDRSEFIRECLRKRLSQLEQHNDVDSKGEISEIRAKLRSPWLYYNHKGTGSDAVGIGNGAGMHRFLIDLKESAISVLPPNVENRAQVAIDISQLTWSDIRDAFADHIMKKSSGNIFMVKRALNHNSVRVTRHYIRQRRQIASRFDAFTRVMDVLFAELSSNRAVDHTILFLASNYNDFGDADRKKLREYRSRLGMGCLDPVSPERFLSAQHQSGAQCAVQRCILCRQGVVFSDAFEGIAIRHAELVWLRENSTPTRWLTSTLSWELDAIELLRDKVFSSQATSFKSLSIDRLTAIRSGKAFVFDEPEIAGIFL